MGFFDRLFKKVEQVNRGKLARKVRQKIGI